MALVRCNGVTLAYDEAGSGPAVVFSHAGIADRRMWQAQFTELARDHRVIRYDWRGYGESGSGAASAEFAHHEDLLALLDALGVARASLVGSSMGGAYAVDAALAAPGRVSALVLSCPGLSGHVWPDAMVAQARERVHAVVPGERLASYLRGTAAASPLLREDAEAMAAAHVRWMVAGPERDERDLAPETWRLAVAMYRQQLERAWTKGPRPAERAPQPPAGQRLGEVAAPTLVINGLADVPQIQEVAGRYAAGIPGARRVDLPDTGHLPPLERPAAVTAALRAFLPRE